MGLSPVYTMFATLELWGWASNWRTWAGGVESLGFRGLGFRGLGVSGLGV